MTTISRGGALQRRPPGNDATGNPPPCSADPELFFPPGYGDAYTSWVEKARAVCRSCPQRAACLQWALTHPSMAEHGIWGGTTPMQRRAWLRANQKTPKRDKQPEVTCTECGRTVRLVNGRIVLHTPTDDLLATTSLCAGSAQHYQQIPA